MGLFQKLDLVSQVLNTSNDGGPVSTILCSFLNVHSERPKPEPLTVGTFYTIIRHDQEEFGFIVFVTHLQAVLGSYDIVP